MKKIKNIYLFDFDNTLVEEPEYYRKYDNESDEFMDSKKSLKHDFEIKEDIKSIVDKSTMCENSITVILTNRSFKLENDITEILSSKGIELDDTLFREKDRSKGNRLKDFLESMIKHEFDDIENVYFWDDKEKHINDVKNISNEFPYINFEVNLVT